MNEDQRIREWKILFEVATDEMRRGHSVNLDVIRDRGYRLLMEGSE